MSDKNGHDNELLVEFEFLIDLDLAMFKFVKDKYKDSPFVNQRLMNEMDEKQIIYDLLNRPHINPLEIIMDSSIDPTKLYYEIMETHYEDLLTYATAYDTFGLMITFLNNASSVGITVLCKSKLESDFIKKLNPILRTIIIPNRRDVILKPYTALYIKYFANAVQYNHIEGKHIYVACAKFNMEEDKDMMNGLYSYLFSDVNIIHLMDLYTKVKFRYRKEDKKDEDLL